VEAIEERVRARERVVGEAKAWAQRLGFPATVILIGSYARGDFNLWSDVDLLLIADFKGGPLERLKSLDFPAGFEVIPLTPRELMRLVERGDPLAFEALNDVYLRDDLGIKELLEKKLAHTST
jgi:predicted nucleotidyltransferase